MNKSYSMLLLILLIALLYGGLQTANLQNTRNDLKQLQISFDSLNKVSTRLDTQYVRDTILLRRLIRSTDTLTQTVELWKHDTVQVVRYVTQTDSTIKACNSALHTCEEKDAINIGKIVNLQEQLRKKDDLIPSRWDYIKRDTRSGLIGAVIALTVQSLLNK